MYLQKVIEHCGMLNAKSTSTPLLAGYYAAKNTEPVDVELRSHFQMVIGVQIIHKGALLCPVSETKIRGMLQNTDLVPSVRD